jgi:SPP1 gp7 family putative phage head morphogenesis protein
VSINEEIRDNIIKYRRLLIRAENQIVRDASEILGKNTDKILDEIGRILRDGEVDTVKMRNVLRKRLLPIFKKRTRELETFVNTLVDDLLKTHNQLVYLVMEGPEINNYIKLNKVTFRQLKILMRRPLPVFAMGYEDELAELLGRQYRKLQQIINQAYMDGKGYKEMVSVIRKDFQGMSTRYTETYLRTLVQNVSSVVEREWITQNKDIIKGVTWVGTLDKRTCPQCAVLDNRRWDNPADAPSPPVHHGCRCFLTPYLKSAKELGLPERKSNQGFRESMNGVVPGSPSFSEWFERLPSKDKVFILGESRYNMYINNGLKFEDLVRENTFITLKDLRGYYGQ